MSNSVQAKIRYSVKFFSAVGSFMQTKTNPKLYRNNKHEDWQQLTQLIEKATTVHERKDDYCPPDFWVTDYFNLS